MWFVYILLCADNTYYTGITNDVEKRLSSHNSGKGAKYTRGRVPVVLMFMKSLPDKGSALKYEFLIKSLRRDDKTKLIEGSDNEI